MVDSRTRYQKRDVTSLKVYRLIDEVLEYETCNNKLKSNYYNLLVYILVRSP